MFIYRLCDDFHTPENMKPDLSTHITPLTTALSNLNIDQKILTMNSETNTYKDIEIEIIPQRRPFSFLRTGLEAYKIIRKDQKNPDIIHFHNPRFASILLKKKQLPPIVMTIHDSPKNVLKSINTKNLTNTKQTLYYYNLAKYSSKHVDSLVCVSPGVREEIIESWNLPEDKVYVATTAADTNIFYPKKTEKKIDILFVGRLVEKKRPLDFIKIIERIKATNPNVKSTMIGASKKDPLYTEIKKSIKRLNLEKNISMIEPVSQDKLREYYNSSKMLILPSSTESAPKVTLEAMACGIPVITTDISGNKEITLDNKTGYIVPPKDIESFTEKAEYLLNNNQKRENMGNFASNRIKKEFTWEATAKKYKEIYEKLSETRT